MLTRFEIKRWSRVKKVVKWLLIISLLSGAVITSFLILVNLGFWGPIPSKQELSNIQNSQATQVFASGGELIGKFYHFDRVSIRYKDLPDHLIKALVATEDARFFKHKGIDYRSLLRVLFKTILLQDPSSGGGSTLTQQLAKNLYPREIFSNFGLLINKTKESIIAGRLEELYSKNEIITLYLNTVSFSDNTYGIESAAQRFFNKNTAELSIEQSATLVGTLKANHTYNPRLFPEKSRQRRNVVLSQMVKYGYLPDSIGNELKTQPLSLDYSPVDSHEIAPYFKELIRRELMAWADTAKKDDGSRYQIHTDGLKVFTTLDYKMQLIAQEAVNSHLTALQKEFERSWGNQAPWITDRDLLWDAVKQSHYYQDLISAGWKDAEIVDSLSMPILIEIYAGPRFEVREASVMDSISQSLKQINTGFLVLDAKSGAVKVWVGGKDFKLSQFDHIAQSRRQVGSTFKPIVYATALEMGLDPCDHYPARLVAYENLDGWTPSNSDENYDLSYSMQAALSKSINTVAVKIIEETGIMPVIQQAKAMGIKSDLPKVPSIALGSASLRITELATAYSTFVNGGIPTLPHFLNRIEDREGNLLAEFTPVNVSSPVINETTRQLMLEMMKATVNEGTAVRIRNEYGLRQDLAGKTGTTQLNKDGWFVALTPDFVAVTWVGNDDFRIGFRTSETGQGANSALPIFATWYQTLSLHPELRVHTQNKFPKPDPTVLTMLDCEPVKEPGFLQRLFTNTDKPKIKSFDADSVKKDNIFIRLKKLFQKKKKTN